MWVGTCINPKCPLLGPQLEWPLQRLKSLTGPFKCSSITARFSDVRLTDVTAFFLDAQIQFWGKPIGQVQLLLQRKLRSLISWDMGHCKANSVNMTVTLLYVWMLVRECTSLEEIVENGERQLQPGFGPFLSLRAYKNVYIFLSTGCDYVLLLNCIFLDINSIKLYCIHLLHIATSHYGNKLSKLSDWRLPVLLHLPS